MLSLDEVNSVADWNFPVPLILQVAREVSQLTDDEREQVICDGKTVLQCQLCHDLHPDFNNL